MDVDGFNPREISVLFLKDAPSALLERCAFCMFIESSYVLG